MHSQISKLLTRDFLILIIGQIMSLFGNAILRFSIPLYLLSKNGSTVAFSVNLAVSVLPIIFLSPVNGLIADLFPKRSTLIYLDLLTSFVCLLSLHAIESSRQFLLFTTITLLLSIIQAIYQPTVLSSISLLLPKTELGIANALVNQVQSLANIIGPALGGILFNYFGIQLTIILALFSFLASAILEIFMRIPKLNIEKRISWRTTIKVDTLNALTFLRKNPILLKISLLVAIFNLFFESILIIGLPHVILNTLQLDSTFYGLSQSAQSLGALSGSLTLTLFINHLKMNRSYLLFASTIVILLPIPISLFLRLSALPTVFIICICCFLFMIVSTIFSIMMLSFIQSITPNRLMGKIISYIYALTACTRPFGQILYGFLFEAYSHHAALIFMFTIVINLFVSFYARKILSPIKQEDY
ncbi:hypothetical protein IGI39_001229 [Enterococcus sp. AZ135]|uniref:MFS transporter n=1 Tax=unclassified Enterococcus TaxID=2608891 RepID=UPI003F263410